MRQIKLGTKIISGFGIAVLLMGVVVGIYQFAVSRATSGYDGLLKGEVAVLMHAGKVKSAMLQARRDEKDFLLRLDLKYVDKHKENIDLLKQEAVAIAKIESVTGDRQMAADAIKISQLADLYRQDFLVLVAAQKEAGLDSKSGDQGEFRKAAHGLEATMPEHDVDAIYISFLTMRRFEKDYYQLSNETNKNNFSRAVQDFTALLATSPCDAVAKQQIQAALSKYQQGMAKFMATGKNIKKAKQYNDMRKEAKAMDVAIKSIKVPGVMAIMQEIRKHEKDFMLRRDKKYVDKTHKTVERLYNAFVRAGVLQEHIDDIKSQLAVYSKSFDALVGEYDEINVALSKMKAAVHQIEPLVDSIYKSSLKETAAQNISISEQAHSLATTAITIALGIMVTAMLIAFFLTRSITKPIDGVVSALTAGAEQVAAASSEVSSSSQSLAEGTSEQAASIEETSATMEEMSSMTNQNADNASQADSLMTAALKTIKDADDAMTKIGESMGEISIASEETSKIVKTIDEIAFQTNLLALNAAVEAARAGEAGAGFAVVADEVRNLAMRAAEAAKNTSVLIEDTVIKVNKGKEVVLKANDSFASVTEASAKIGSLVSEIATASKEQAQGFVQINQAVTQMDGVTQQNSATAEESAAASEELSAQAAAMMEAVNVLKSMVEGASSGSSNTPMMVSQPRPKKTSQLRKLPQPSAAQERTATIKAAASGKSRETPEDIIPMDSDGDFEDF